MNLNDTFWNHSSPLQAKSDKLRDLIPDFGSVEHPRKNPALEKFRKASNCYYDLYNNGLCKRKQEFRDVFGFGASRYMTRNTPTQVLFAVTEAKMNEIVEAAWDEQTGRVTI